MVSQPDHHSTMTIRGPSSVVHAPSSRPSFSRTKRYNRSHAGGSSYVPQNEFPVFSNSGDVEILVRTAGGEHTSRYLLHRDTLTRCSGFFEASTSDEWSRAKTLTAGDEVARIGENLVTDGRELGPVRKRWRYELDWGDDGTDIPMLMQKDEEAPKLDTTQSLFGGPDALAGGTSRKQSSSASNHSFFRSVANLSLTTTSRHSRHPSASQTDVMVPAHLSQQDQDVLRDYDNMLRIFYNYSPVLDSISIADAYVQCKSLLTLADQYDALAVVGPRVDHHLLQFQSRLWKQVAKYPISYLRLGYLAHSRIIFQEALIHVVGQWPAGERSIRSALPESVVELILDKVDDLEEAVSRAETRLFRLGLSTARGERVTPQNGYLDWLALSLFRQWLADNTAPPPAPAPTPGSAGSTTSGSGRGSRHGQRGSSQAVQKSVMTTIPPLAALGRAYRILGSNSSSAYLTHDECKRFLKLSPELYSRDNLRRFEKRIEELKSQARDIVRPLMGSSLELDAAAGGEGGRAPGNGLGYLTCTRVQEGEMPWGEEYAGLIA